MIFLIKQLRNEKHCYWNSFCSSGKMMIIQSKQFKSDNSNVAIRKNIKIFLKKKGHLSFLKKISMLKNLRNGDHRKLEKNKKRTHKDLSPFLKGRDCVYVLQICTLSRELKNTNGFHGKVRTCLSFPSGQTMPPNFQGRRNIPKPLETSLWGGHNIPSWLE